jgi:FtsZ-binding cell division protein ZapB
MIDILFTWRRLQKQVEELKFELDALHEAFHQSEKAREKAITERENMKRERDEYAREADCRRQSYMELREAMLEALGIGR